MFKKLPLVLASITFLAVGGITLGNVLDTFFIEHAETTVEAEEEDFTFDSDQTESSSSSTTGETSTTSTKTNTSNSNNTTVTYTKGSKKIGKKSVTYHLVEINLKKVSDLRTKLATNNSGSVGANITQSLDEMVQDVEDSGTEVLCAISGDFAFWSGRTGYVIRNGVSYRSSQRSTSGEDFAIFKDGSVKSYFEDDLDFSSLESMNEGCYQNWCFGPTLLDNGSIAVDTDEEIDGRSMSNNERTAIGYAGPNHFYFLNTEVNGSRNSSSAASFSLYNLAELFQDLGCTYAYNLDGGGSAGMIVNGEYKLEPERELGDMIYVVNA
ncbi:MAG: phosphodiester glycosidase family protein [Bacilli bacterium]|nr:phosphodiester glycosidase family protein [Bacilli bacterium]